MQIVDWLCDALFGAFCCVCGRTETAFCVECAPFVHERHVENLRIAELPLCALGLYGDQLRPAVLHMKDGRRDVAQALAMHLADRVRDLPWLVDAVLVPLPTAAHRRRLRGLDGPACLARTLGRRLGLPVVPALLLRGFSAQRGKNRRERLEAAGRYGVRRATALQGKAIVLIDDVVTTGATLRDAALVLRAAGAEVRGALALARTPSTPLKRDIE